RVQSSFEPNDFEVLLSTTGIAPGDFTNVISPLAEYDNTDYIEYVFDLSAYSGISYIAFHVPDGGLDGWRLYIDNFIVETIPACGYPSGLNISNITGTTADFDWVAQNGNESWEYVIVPTGDPAPTGAGVFTAVNSTTFTDLDFLTTYDVYVRAYCGTDDGYSIWSGPETFTTTQQTNYTVDCASGQPVNIEYCYTNNDTTFWVFTSTDGFPLEITFNAGTIEANWDDLTIYDGSDNSGAILFNNNSAGINDLTGVVVESTSTSIYIEVDSDSSVSCSSSTTYSPWDFDVTCKTCITQTVEFDIVGSCEPNQEFYVEANITDMGGAVNLELTDNQGSAAQTATAASVVTFGPYAANTQVVISVLNTDDTSCLLESDTLTFLCPPPPNECSIVYAGEDTTFCSDNDPATVLTASYHIAGQDTTSYDVTSLDECPAPILEGGTPTSIDTDDIWSDAIDLGFDFCFFGETYSQILIGSNGVLSFELENAGTGNGWDLQGFGSSTPDQLPNSSNTTISEANIFGVGHDIDPSDCGEINYMVLGTAPARQFVVNYNDVCHFGLSCSDYTSTFQIILYESSNFIDVNIIDKPICTEWNDGLAVVGIQNIDDTIAFTPEDRNTSAWEASNESWRFSPSVGEADYIFEWYDGDTVVGTEDTITVYPEETTTYTAAVTYNLCNGETATVTDTVLVEITPTPIPVAVENDVFICAGEEAVLEVNIDASAQSPDVIYYWTYDNVDIQSGPENTFVFAEGAQAYGEYLVTAYNEETACYASTVITVLPGIVPELEEDTSFNKCVNGEVELSVNIINDPDMTSEYNYAWYVDNQLIAEDTSGSFIHGADLTNGPVVVMVTNLTTSCASETIINVNYFQNQNCVDIPQGISPNGDGLNDCLVLDHLEEQEDIVKAEIYNRYGVKVFELNDYVDHWCGQDASSGSSDELLPVGTYFYVIQYASGREPTISWIYLNY
ncbi:MAG: gliding motility-associated C-terminal domain-containing protein, partial [Bacteroidetes bacterium]|nr:gliding motility-associated C-terminal domain-containing protein [Bacteroidota bacterium]